MATKAILSVTAAVPADKVEATRAKVAAHLGLAVEDVLVVHGASVTVAEVPAAASKGMPEQSEEEIRKTLIAWAKEYAAPRETVTLPVPPAQPKEPHARGKEK